MSQAKQLNNPSKNPNNNPSAVLFDLDGTILDTARDLGNALNAVMSEIGLPKVSYQDYRDFASHGSVGLLKLGLQKANSNRNIDDLKPQFLNHYEKNINQATTLFDGMALTLKQLEDRGITWGVVTNKPGYLTDQLTVQFPELENCQVIISGDTLPQRKPDPAPLIYAAKQIDIEPSKCWYIGDALRDIQAGNAANMKTFSANWGYTKEEIPVDQWGADIQLTAPQDLLNYIN